MTVDGEFRFPPILEDQSTWAYGEFKYITMWELWAEPHLWEILSDARALSRPDGEAQFERLISELIDEGYAQLTQRPWNDRDATPEPLPPTEIAYALANLREAEAWRSHPVDVRLVPTPKWHEWARIHKGV